MLRQLTLMAFVLPFVFVQPAAAKKSVRLTSSSTSVVNGSFESGLSPWTFGLSSGATGTQYLDSGTHSNGAYSEAIQVWKPVAGCAWCAQLSQSGISLSAGQTLTFSFSAKASSARTIEAGIQQSSGSYTWYTLQHPSLGTGWATYSFTLTPNVSDPNAVIHFNFGNAAGNIWIDNVSLTGGGSPADTQAPTVPAGLSATAVSSSQINLTWSASTDNVGVSGYKIYRAGALVANVTGTSYSNTGLSASTSYSYAISAFDAAGNASALSSVVSATTQASGGSGGAGALPPPAGYSTAQLIFDDQFTSPSLDTSKWNPWLGEDVYGRWSDQGKLASPYSAMNAGGYQIQYYDPYPYGSGTNTTGQHLTGGNGVLGLSASPSNYFSGLGYSWASAAVSTYGKAYLPAAGGYVQFRAKMPDSRYGAWAGLWFMPSAGSDGKEFDLQESGYFANGAPNSNYVLASHWWGGGSQIVQNTGVDLSADYHTYGVEYRPGQYWKVYLDGNLMTTFTSGVSTNAAYEIIMDLEFAGSSAAGWHTVADPVNHPGPFQLNVTNVQIYKLP